MSTHAYLVWCPEYGGTREDAREFQALNHEDAAEIWAERFDRTGDYTIIGGETVLVMVCIEDERVPKVFSVTGETIARYYAREHLG